jgi:alanine-synthesizing transaminase
MAEFYRTRRLPPYVFAEVNRLKLEARQAGRDIIDLGMGNPDMPTPQHIVDKLITTVQDPKTHGYSVSKGIVGLRKAKANYYQRRFNVELDFDSEVVVSIGSKEGLANLAQAISSPGDVILVPSPSYPIHPFGFIIAGATIRQLPVEQDDEDDEESYTSNFLLHLERAVRYSTPKPTALILNYPCNPTTRVVSLAFYQQIVDFCLEHGIYIISDLAYSEIYFDDDASPPSILQVENAKRCSVEFTSMSKTYAMAGWRVGFACGSSKLVAALARVKSYVDYGAFTPIQVAATAALNGDQSCVEQMREIYKKRRDILVQGLSKAGWEVKIPRASMFIWAKLPEQFLPQGSLAFSKWLLEHANVAVAPGVGFGEYGEGYVRIGLVENEQRIRQACRNIKRALKS